MDVFHFVATLFLSRMKNTVDASIIAVAIQKDIPTMSVSFSIPFVLCPLAATLLRVSRLSAPTSVRHDVLVSVDLFIEYP